MALAVMLVTRIFTVLAADTWAFQTSLASMDAGAATYTVSPVAAPVTVTVSSAPVAGAMDGKSSVAEADRSLCPKDFHVPGVPAVVQKFNYGPFLIHCVGGNLSPVQSA